MISERSETTAFSLSQTASQTVTNESSSPSIAITLTVDPQSDAPRNNITTQQVTKLDGECMHIPSQSPETRRILAEITIGPKAIQDPTFYSSLHEKQKCDDYAIAENGVGQPDLSDFSGTAWNLVRSEADNSDTPDSDLIDFKDPTNSRKIDVDAIVKQIQEFADDITTRVKENAVVAQGMQTFLRRYQNLTQNGTFQNARLSSALHRFGWVFGGTIRSSQGGYMHRGRRIPVNAKAAGRRRKFVSRGKAKLPSGHPKGMKIAQYPTSRYQLPCHKQPPGKRLHSLQANILSGTQNAGKWYCS